MCDDTTEIENAEYFKAQQSGVSRRTFGAIAGVGGLSTLFAGCKAGETTQGIVENDVNVETPDGIVDSYYVHPASGTHPAVILWPDIMGLRPSFKTMGKRLAMAGYSVLVVNPFYREAKHPVISDGENFSMPEVRERLRPMARALTPQAQVSDANAFLAWLDAQPNVDTSRKVGIMGYCMSGSFTMRAAAARPGRIGAGASFHGGRLATDREDSPHLLVPQMKSGFLFAIAENDDERDPEAKNILREAYDNAGLFAEIEVYAGARHGWCPPDSLVYNEAQAEKAWARLLSLFETYLV